MPAAFTPPAPRWLVRPAAPPMAVEALARTLEVPPALAALLWARGLRDAAPDHLEPPLVKSPNPALDAAAERLEEAVRARRRILIHGDYDADGISGTAVLLLGLRELGANVEAFIPDRLTDGYGIHPDRVPEHAERAELFVTVDCGITNVSEIERLRAAGVDVIVTDHHTPGDVTPECLVVHPRLSPLARHGLPELTGAGVAFHLLWALRERLGLEPPFEYADLAALGTIADVAPLLGENRALIREGLTRMTTSRWPGVRASVSQAKLRAPVTARNVAFVLAPRLNAAGRLGEADLGLELLTTGSERRARELAVYLDARNVERRRIQDEMFEEALEKVDPQAPALVLEDPGWHAGIMGIVASKLLEAYYRPVYIATAGKGSVRSTPGISAVGGLRAAAAHLKRFGGHRQAAGFALDMDVFPAFRDAIYAYVASHPDPVPAIVADAVMTSDEVNDGLWRAIQALEPFGEGHPAPLFALTGRLDAARAVGKDGNTLQLRVAGVKGVGWRMGNLARSLPLGEFVNVAATLNESEWNGAKSVEFIADAVRPAEPLALAPEVGDDVGDEARDEAGDEAAAAGASGERSGADPEAAPAPTLRRASATGGSGTVRTQRSLPDGDSVAALESLARGPEPVALALDERQLHAIEMDAIGYPTVGELRRGLVAVRRGAPLPFDRVKNDRIRVALQELDLVDDRGHARRLPNGAKLSPYASTSLMQGLMRRYRLRTFVHAYRYLDDDGFERTARRLFGPEARSSAAPAGGGPRDAATEGGPPDAAESEQDLTHAR
jgi:single-stranded-DNA-specific exonuclease